MEGITSILRALRPKWGCTWVWVLYTLFFLLGKGIRVLIFCFPPEKWKFSFFCSTKRNKNLVVSSTPTSTLPWPVCYCVYLAPFSNITSLPFLQSSLSPATDFFFVPWGNQDLFCLRTLHMVFLLTEHFLHISSHCHSLVSTLTSFSGRTLLRESQPSYKAVEHVTLSSIISLLPLLIRI